MPKHAMKLCWLHVIWSTKDRFPFFQNEQTAMKCYKIIKEICDNKEIYLKIGYVNAEHVHLLIDLPVNMTIESLMQNLKGISSHEINKSEIFKVKFSWSRGYGLFSVSESSLDKVIEYIRNQREHHLKRSFREEWEVLQKKYEETVKTVLV